MARIEDTAGNIIITIDNCDCGLTSGCEKCRPIFLPKPTNFDNRLTPTLNIIYTPNPFLLGLVQKGMEDIKAGRIKKIPNIKKVKEKVESL